MAPAGHRPRCPCGRTHQQPAPTGAGSSAHPLLLTYVREHPDAALHRGLLAGHEPGAVVHPEHPLQQLHEHGLPGLQGKQSTVTASPQSRAQLAPAPAQLELSSPFQLLCSTLLGNSPWWRVSTMGSAAGWEGWEPALEGKHETGASAAESPAN